MEVYVATLEDDYGLRIEVFKEFKYALKQAIGWEYSSGIHWKESDALSDVEYFSQSVTKEDHSIIIQKKVVKERR